MRVLRTLGLVSLTACISAAGAQAATLEPIGSASDPPSFNQPVFLTSDPENAERLFVVEQAGEIELVTPTSQSTFLDIKSQVEFNGEEGLASMAFAPDFATSGLFYVFFVNKSHNIEIAEFHAAGNTADPTSKRLVLSIAHPPLIPPATRYQHYGGQLQFGPDGFLYVSVGDGSGCCDNAETAQDLTSLLGKLLRIDPRQSGAAAYTVPADNPFAGGANDPAGGALDEIWAYGFRNPWRFSFDRYTGALTLGDVGEGNWEEVNYRTTVQGAGRGTNFGWSCFEGSQAYAAGYCPGAPSAPVPPIFEYAHTDSPPDPEHCSVIGGYVVRDPGLSEIFGRYLYSDLCSTQLRTLNPATPSDETYTGISLSPDRPTSFGEDACGRLYVTYVFGFDDVRRVVGDNGGVCTMRTLNVSVSGSGQVTGPGVACPGDCTQALYDGKRPKLTASAPSGSRFTGWSGDCSGAGACAPLMDATRSVTATFESITAPSITGPSGPTNDNDPSFIFSSSEPGGFQCRLDGPGAATGSFAGCTPPKSYTDLADGAYAFRVKSVDGSNESAVATRSFTVDTVAPTIAIDSGPTGATNDSTPTFSFTTGGGSTQTRCSIDTGTASFGACSGPGTHTPSALTDNSYTFRVKSIDAATNESTVATRSFSVDTAAPTVAIDSGPTGPTNDSTPTFNFTAGAGATQTRCSVDTGTASFGACSGSGAHTPSALADGSYTFRVKSIDAATNESAVATRSFTVDTVAPQTTISAGGPTGATNNNDPSFAFTSSESGTFECRLDGPGSATGTFSSCAPPKTYTDLADGAYTLQVRAIDAALNSDGSAATRSFTVDTAPPSIAIDGGPNGPTNDSTPTFDFTAGGGATQTRCSIDTGSASFGACSGSGTHTPSALADGNYTFRVKSIDAATNESTVAMRSFSIDTAVPSIAIDDGPSGPTNDSTPTFDFTAGNGATQTRCSIDSGTAAFAPCSSPYTPDSLVDGSYTFRVKSIDAATNESAVSTRGFTVDTLAPTIAIDNGPSGPTNDSTPTFNFTAGGGTAQTRCSTDTGTASFAPCSSPHTPSTLSDGSYTFRVKAADAASNESAVSARSFTVDTVAPQTTITDGPAGMTNDDSPSFSFTSNEPGSTFTCALDGASAPCSPPKAYPGLADGPHTLEVHATDAAANADATPASVSFTVDTTAPETTITAGPSGLTCDHHPSFSFTASEAATTFTCALDGVTASCASPQSYFGLADGPHRFEVSSTDALANTDPTPAASDFTVETALVIDPLPKAQTALDLSARKQRVRRGRRARLEVTALPCGGRVGDPVALLRDDEPVATAELDDDCAARFRPRIRRAGYFSVSIEEDDLNLAAVSQRVRIRLRRR